MNVAEFAKILACWPKAALPTIATWHGVGGYVFRAYSAEESVPDEHVDLACMAGLRWLMDKDANGEVRIVKEGPSHYGLDACGSMTLSHFSVFYAIDAAVRQVASDNAAMENNQ